MQSSEPVAIQLQLQQVPLQGLIPIVINLVASKDIFIQIRQLVLLQVQLFQADQPVEGSAAKAPEPVAFQPQAAKMPETIKGIIRKRRQLVVAQVQGLQGAQSPRHGTQFPNSLEKLPLTPRN